MKFFTFFADDLKFGGFGDCENFHDLVRRGRIAIRPLSRSLMFKQDYESLQHKRSMQTKLRDLSGGVLQALCVHRLLPF